MIEINYTTIVIPTHERRMHLLRSISFFSKINANVIYVDSSEKGLEGVGLPSNIQYYHLPGLKFYQKALYAINKINTKFVGFCADDDFLIPTTIKKAEDYLEDNLVASVVGRYLAFDEGKLDFYKIQSYNEFPAISVSDTENVINYMSRYHQILWAVYRIDLIKNAYQMIEKLHFSNDNFIEISIASIMSSNGGIKVLDDVMGVREITISDHWGKRHKSIGLSYQDRDKEVSVDIEKLINESKSYIPKDLIEVSINTYLKANNGRRFSVIKK